MLLHKKLFSVTSAILRVLREGQLPRLAAILVLGLLASCVP
jgi:hypothetical protein